MVNKTEIYTYLGVEFDNHLSMPTHIKKRVQESYVKNKLSTSNKINRNSLRGTNDLYVDDMTYDYLLFHCLSWSTK